MKQRLAPALQDDRLYVMKIGNKFFKIAEAHICGHPIGTAVPDAHAAGKRAARSDLDLPGKECLVKALRKQF